MLINFVFLILLTSTINSLRHEQRVMEVIAHARKLDSTWKPRTNEIFNGTEEKGTKKYLGINIDKLKRETIAQARSTKRLPTRDHRFKNWSRYSNWSNPESPLTDRNRTLGNSNVVRGRNKRETIPAEFDWRKFDCESFRAIRYQNCGDCWAIASASVMSDRYCLWTGKNKTFSAREIVTCAYPLGGGCNGGVPNDAMSYYHNKGVSSGGDSRVVSDVPGCLPYLTNISSQTTCPKTCDSGQTLDRTKAGEYRDITSQKVTDIMNEIYKFGPVVAVFQVFDDFEYMGTGVYKHVWGNSQGYHAVRLLGYGTENDTDYWLAANSWGTGWGDKGYFKILRGQNHCDIESWVATVYPPEAY